MWVPECQIIMTTDVLTSHDNKQSQTRQSSSCNDDWVIESSICGVTENEVSKLGKLIWIHSWMNSLSERMPQSTSNNNKECYK